MYKFGIGFTISFCLLTGLGVYGVVSDAQSKVEQEEKFAIDETNIAAFVHSWNLKAYVNKSLVRFYDGTSSEGVRMLTVVNVPVDFKDKKNVDEHIVWLKTLSENWYAVSNTRIVQIINPKGKIIMTVDAKGKLTVFGNGKPV